MKGAAALVLLVAFVSAPGAAQPVLPPSRPADLAPATPPAPSTQPPPYEVKLDRLAELMGTLAFLRDLCGADDGQTWRGKMNDLLASEGTTPDRRDRLAGAFNRGFDGYRMTYRRCTPAATLVIERTLAEGATLAGELSSHFGG